MKKLLLLIAFFALWVMTFGQALAETRYVLNGAGASGCSNGSTNYDTASKTCGGGSSTVYLTIGACKNSWGTTAGAGADNTCQVEDTATYAEELSDSWSGGTSWASPFTLTVRSGVTVWLQPSAGAARCMSIGQASNSSNYSYIIIDQINCDGVNISSDGIKAGGNAAQYGHHIRLQNLEVKNATANQGVLFAGDGSEMINVYIHDSGGADSFKHALYWTVSNGLLERSLIEGRAGQSGYSLHVYDTNGPSNNEMRYNIFRNRTALVAGRGSGTGANNNLFHHNIIDAMDADQQALYTISTASSGNKIYNNTITDGTYCYWNKATNTEWKNNICTGYTTGSVNVTSGNILSATNRCTSAGTGCETTGSPSYANEGGGDYNPGDATLYGTGTDVGITGYQTPGALQPFSLTCKVDDGATTTLKTFPSMVQGPAQVAAVTGLTFEETDTARTLSAPSVTGGGAQVNFTIGTAVSASTTLDFYNTFASHVYYDSLQIGGTNGNKNSRWRSVADGALQCTNFVSAASSGTLRVVSFRARRPGYAEDATSALRWAYPESVASGVMQMALGGKTFLYYLIGAETAAFPATAVGWYFRVDTGGGFGAWTALDDSCATNPVRFAQSIPSSTTHLQNITAELSDGAFTVDGAQAILVSTGLPTLNLAQDSAYVLALGLEVCSGGTASVGDVVEVRPEQADGTDFNTYTATPNITVGNRRMIQIGQ